MRPEVLKTAKATRLSTLAAAAVALTLTGLSGCENQAEKAYRERYAKAEALFKERCKTAGVVIHRTVKDVAGIELTKVRPKLEWADKRYFDPMFDGAAMAAESSGTSYIWQFLQSEFRYISFPERRGTLGPPGTAADPHLHLAPLSGYRFVEHIETGTGNRIRCKATFAADAKTVDELMHCVHVSESMSQFALDYKDLVDAEDRALWVAGTELKVVDKGSGEVIAQLTRYVWDPGFGVSGTGRWPWQHASSAASRTCPSDPNQLLHHDSRYFVDTVLIPKQGDQP